MKLDQIVLNAPRNVTLTAYLQGVEGEFPNIPRRPAMLVLPGGGYRMCSDREADPVALAYAQAGFQTFILRYSVGENAVWPNPLEDYEQAMTLIRSNADRWNLYPDKVAVIGFSAGGHLAACAATMAKNRPNAAVLGYAVTDEATAKSCLASAPSAVDSVDQNTCPCFLFATRTDELVPIRNTMRFSQALEEYGVMFESHIYAYGPHGFSTADSSVLTPETNITPRAGRWVADSITWLRDTLGDFGAGELTAPKCGNRVNDNYEPFCSVDCTISHLMQNAQARAVLAPLMKAAQEKMAQLYGEEMTVGNESDSVGLGANMTLRAALAYGRVPQTTVDALDEQLRRIPNL